MIAFASTNKGKYKEVKLVATEFNLNVYDFDFLKTNHSSPPNVDETGSTYKENAFLKLNAYYAWLNPNSTENIPVLADDSGLEIFALPNILGVHTSSFGGEGVSYKEKIDLLLEKLKGIEQRSARYVCLLLLKTSDSSVLYAEGIIEGRIAEKPYEIQKENADKNKSGFGYDPIFIPNGYDKSLAELKEIGESVPTHRIKALREIFRQYSYPKK